MPRRPHQKRFLVPAAQRDAANAALRSFGHENILSIPIYSGKEMAKEGERESQVTHYAVNWRGLSQTELDIARRQLQPFTVDEQDVLEQPDFDRGMDELNRGRDPEKRRRLFCACVIPDVAKGPVIARLTALGLVGTFFDMALSRSGRLPAEAWADRWELDPTFLDSGKLQWLADNVPRCWIVLSVRDRSLLERIQSHPLAGQDYRDENWQSRTKAYVFITGQIPSGPEVLNGIAARSNPRLVLSVASAAIRR